MSEWIKSMWTFPLRKSIEGINIVTTNAITLIFNLYGQRLLKIDTDQIIKTNEHKDDRDNFYLHPLHLKEIEQRISLTSLKIEGDVTGLLISIPWKAIISEPTIVSIEEISLNMSCQKTSQTLDVSILDNHSYFADKKHIDKEDLINTYKEIYKIILQYFNQISLEVKICTINLQDCFVIVIHNISYSDNSLIIEKIIVRREQTLLELNKIKLSNSQLSIHKVIINKDIVEHLPEFYIDDKGDAIKLNVTIDILEMDKSHVNGIRVDIGPDIMISAESLVVEDILVLKSITAVYKQGVCVFNPFTAKVTNLSELLEWNKHILLTFKSAAGKIISDTPASSFMISNLNMNVILAEEIISISISELLNCDILQLNILYDGVKCSITKVSLADIVQLSNIMINSTFSAQAEIIEIKKDASLDIIFHNASTSNATELVNFIKKLIDNIYIEKPDDLTRSTNNISTYDPLVVNLSFYDTRLCLKYKHDIFEFQIKHGNVCLTSKEAFDIEANILLGSLPIAQVKINKLTMKRMHIQKLKILMDPEVFDRFNYLLGTLNIETEDQDDHAVLSQSTIVNSVYELEEEIHNSIVKQSLEKALVDIRTYVIDDYQIDNNEELELDIVIDSLYIYLYDKLNQVPKDSFLCIVLSDINFKKIIESKYSLNVQSGKIIDMSCKDPEWKYFVKFSQFRMLNINVSLTNDAYRISLSINPIVANIREETLVRLLAFFSASHHVPKSSKPIVIKYFNANAIEFIVNYNPMVLQQITTSGLSLKDHKISLQSIVLTNITGFDILLLTIGAKWKSDVNPDNFLQFIPNVKVIQPFALPIMQLAKLISYYFKHSHNKKKIRAITRNINQGTDLISYLIKTGICQVCDLFI